jgi:hypothetical protein
MNASEFVEPPYIEALRRGDPDFAKLSAVQIELKLAAWPIVEQITGLSQHEHRKRAMARLFPSRVWHPWRERLLAAFHKCKTEKLKELMLLGSANSTKTSTLADLILTIWLENPGATSVYITSPYKDATETGLWARVLEQFEEYKSMNPELPGRLKPSANMIVQWDNNPLSFIKVVSIDAVGKLVGRKSKNFRLGFMLIAADELPEFPQSGAALFAVMANLKFVPNMMLVGAGNFAKPSDALGKFSEPDFPGGYSALRRTIHHEWTSRRGGLVIRFDGDQSPALEDPEKYWFLPNAQNRATLVKDSGGDRTADVYRYWHSFPLIGTDEFTVTNMSKVRSSGCLAENYEWTSDRLIRGGNVDAGFGGDAAVLQPWRSGHVHDGNEILQVFEAWGEPITIPIDVEATLTPEEQIVDFHREWAEKNGVPAENCSFDGSMRASIVQEYARRWTVRVVAMDSGGQATDRIYSEIKEFNPKTGQTTRRSVTWKDKVDNLVSEFWFAFGSALIAKQVRGIKEMSKAVEQLCKREWNWVGKHKKQVEPKKDYKKKNGQRSPNEADALVGGLEMARRLGFKIRISEQSKQSPEEFLKGFLREHQTKDYRPPHEQAPRLALPRGRLHATTRQTSGNGQLHNR